MAESPIMRIESSHSVWLFDTSRMRFLRAERGTDHRTSTLAGEWEPYFALEIEEATGSFTVALNEERTRFLRSYVEPAVASNGFDTALRTAEVRVVPAAD